MYHYQGPGGQHQGLTPEQVAHYVRSAPGQHYVWSAGMANWTLAEQVPALAPYLAPAGPPAGGPPAFAGPAGPAAGPTASYDHDPMAAYREELDALNRMAEREGTGGQFDWWSPGKPAQPGQSVMSPLRIIPMPLVDAQGSPIIDPRTGLPQRAQKFWTRATRHSIKMPDGTNQSFVCIDDHDNVAAPRTCPLCALKRVLDDTRDKALGEFARDIRPQQRCYVNIIDLKNVQSHWEAATQPDGSQGYRVRSKIWGYSKTLHKMIMDIVVAKGTFVEDPVNGRNLTLICNRTGRGQRDIRYNVTDSDITPIPAELYPILQGSVNLDILAKPSTMEELSKVAAEIDPRPRHMRTGSGYTPGAPGGVAAPASGPPAGFPGTGGPPANYGGPPAGYGGPPAAQSYTPPPGGPPPGQYAPVTHAAAPPATNAPPPPGFPPPAAPPPQVPQVAYKYHGPAGTHDGLSPDDVAARVIGGPGPHYVWTDGMTSWVEAEQVPGLGPVIAAKRAPPPASVAPPMAPAAPPPAPAGPPAQPPGPPAAPQSYTPPPGGPPPGPPAGPPAGGPPQPPGTTHAW